MQGLRTQRLEELLRSLFEVEGLYQFLNGLGREVGDWLRPRLSLAELVVEAAGLLERQGRLDELFVRLAHARPPAYERIVVVASLFAVQVARPAPPVRRSRDVIRELLDEHDSIDVLSS